MWSLLTAAMYGRSVLLLVVITRFNALQAACHERSRKAILSSLANPLFTNKRTIHFVTSDNKSIAFIKDPDEHEEHDHLLRSQSFLRYAVP